MLSSTFVQGCALAFRDQGSGEPVVPIQGAGLHGGGWLPQINSLRDNFRTISFDNRGIAALNLSARRSLLNEWLPTPSPSWRLPV
jgi:hypothetical protein